ncbi:MAG: 5' nucleotidase, NT5C type [Vicinamibacterales bacterium]
MIVACDVDGIVCDLHAEWLRRYNRDYDDSLTIEGIHDWSIHKWVKPECWKRIYDYLLAPDLYESISMVPGALEGVRRIRALGHQVLFVSACTYNMTDQKARWLVRHEFCSEGGNALPRDFIAVFNRNHLDAYLLIDDGPHNVRQWVEGKGKPAIMLERAYNLHLLNEVPSAFWMKCTRVRGWDEIARHVELLSQVGP